MLDKKSYKLLKALYKVEYLSYRQIDKITHSATPENGLNNTAVHLSSKQLIWRHYVDKDNEGTPIYDGYAISPDGRAYVEEHRRQLLVFILPYGITTFIALLSLFTTIATNWNRILDFLSTIVQIIH